MARTPSFVPKIMIVDDEPLIRVYACQVIEDAGYAAIEAANAEQAMQLLAHEGVAVVVTDVEMPGSMDGLELRRKASRAGGRPSPWWSCRADNCQCPPICQPVLASSANYFLSRGLLTL